MPDLKIDQLELNIRDAAGHEHRVEPIVLRALGILAERLDERGMAQGASPDRQNVADLSAPPVRLDLNVMSDERAANAIADAVLEALALKLGVQAWPH